MVLALGGKKIIDLMEFLNSYRFYLGPVQPGPGLFVHGTTAFCPLIPAETWLVEAECRRIKAPLSRGQCICSSNACWVSESFACHKEAWKGLSYYLQKMEGTYLLMRDISWSKEQGNSLWVNTSCLQVSVVLKPCDVLFEIVPSLSQTAGKVTHCRAFYPSKMTSKGKVKRNRIVEQ